jgi:tetratricopeptide (TPR) repeat protein
LWNQKVESVGKEISRYSVYTWFDFVEFDKISRGPYRLRYLNPTFIPDRDSAVEQIVDPRPALHFSSRHTKARYLDPIELQAYDLIIQYGVYIPAVIDLIRQRIGNPERIRNQNDRLVAYRILATFKKNRGKSQEAKDLAFKGLRLAKKIKSKDDIAYLLDQLGGIFYNENNEIEALSYFEKEIEFLVNWGTLRAEYHLVGAYRGLAAVLRKTGKFSQAKEAIDKSKDYAEKTDNKEGLRIAAIEETRISGEDSSTNLTQLLASQPSQHVVARVMTLLTVSVDLLSKNLIDDGKQVLEWALADAKRFHFRNQIEDIHKIAKTYRIELNCK